MLTHLFVDRLTSNDFVDQVKKQEDGRWAIHVKDKLKMNSYTELVDSVMVCIGHHSIPRMPHFRDQHLFKGAFSLHMNHCTRSGLLFILCSDRL